MEALRELLANLPPWQVAAGVLIATACVIFFWRMLNGTAKTVIIVLGLLLFVIFGVVPNL